MAYIIIFIASVVGLILASHIRHTKVNQKNLVCHIGKDCNTVIHSPYSFFLGIPVELMGIAYYALMVIGYGSFLIWPGLNFDEANLALRLISITAFLFSAYLVFVQAFILKEWCEWCLTSAALCFIIFLAGFFV